MAEKEKRKVDRTILEKVESVRKYNTLKVKFTTQMAEIRLLSRTYVL